MNAHTSIVAARTVPAMSADDAFALWRGTFVDQYAKLERDCFALLEQRQPAAKAPATFKACLGALQHASQGPSGKALRKTIGILVELNSRRNELVHGSGELWESTGDRWLWRFSHRCGSSGADAHGTIDCDEAAKLLVEINRLSQSVAAHLDNITKSPRQSPPANSQKAKKADPGSSPG